MSQHLKITVVAVARGLYKPKCHLHCYASGGYLSV